MLTYFFNVRNREIGFGTFNTSDIVNLIMDKIPAVSDIYTVYKQDSENIFHTHGISMAAFCTNSSLVDIEDTLQVKSGNISLEPFMYPVLYTNTESELKKRIKIVSKNLNIMSKNGI